MQTKARSAAAGAQRAPSHPLYLNEGLTGKKTTLIVLTVIGCIAILTPKVFYPMMFGDAPPKPETKDQRGPGGCCDVVLDQEKFLNATPPEFGPQLYHKQLNLFAGDLHYPGGVRQERPVHMHPDSIYQAMRERGRAIIPSTPTVPLVERKGLPNNARLVDGRPGPIPGMRPPMGAGQVHQPQTKGNASMGFIMPLYTIGIILFFGYTIMKIACKKPVPNAPYGPAPTDPNFRKEVFGQENGRHVEDLSGTKLGTNLHKHDTNNTATTSTNTSTSRNGSELYNASLSAATAATNLSSSLKQHQHQHQYHEQIQANKQKIREALAAQVFDRETEQLMEIDKLRRKLEDTEKAMSRLIAEMNSDQYDAKKSYEYSTPINGDISNGHTATSAKHEDKITNISSDNGGVAVDKSNHNNAEDQSKGHSRRDVSADRTVAVLGMEVTASCEGGQKWTGRPPTPVFLSHNEHSKNHDDMPEPQEIYLEGALAHESQILISDAKTTSQEIYDEELNGSAEEPAVVISSKMTLSLINLDSSPQLNENNVNSQQNEIESPLADDIEIIGHDEN